MKALRTAALYLACAPMALSWLVGGLLLLLRLAYRPKWGGRVLFLTWRPWVADRWHYSTTMGWVVVFHPSHDARRVRGHEMVHVRQIEDATALGCVVGGTLACAGQPLAGAVVWGLSPAWLLVSYLTSALRHGGDWYRQSEPERAAYAQTGDSVVRRGSTWE